MSPIKHSRFSSSLDMQSGDGAADQTNHSSGNQTGVQDLPENSPDSREALKKPERCCSGPCDKCPKKQ